MILLTTVCIWHGLTTAIVLEDEPGQIVENIALGTLVGLYFLFNLIFVIRIYSVVISFSFFTECERKRVDLLVTFMSDTSV